MESSKQGGCRDNTRTRLQFTRRKRQTLLHVGTLFPVLRSCTLHESDVRQNCRHSYLQSSLAVDECRGCSGSVVSSPPPLGTRERSPSRPPVQRKTMRNRGKNRVLRNTRRWRDRTARQARTADAQRRWWGSKGDDILCANQIVKGIRRRRPQGFFLLFFFL